MRIPKKIKVFTHTYTVNIVDTNDEKKDRDNWGRAHMSKLKIYIDRSLPTTRQEETFIHEMLHAIVHQCGLRHDWDKDEEKYVDRLSNALYMVLKENNLLK